MRCWAPWHSQGGGPHPRPHPHPSPSPSPSPSPNPSPHPPPRLQVGHYLGLDTHDVPAVGPDAPLRPGCVITVEPGLYFAPGPRFGRLAGVGVRIEDVVAVGAGGAPPTVLSAAAPTAPREVEALVGAHAGRG